MAGPWERYQQQAQPDYFARNQRFLKPGVKPSDFTTTLAPADEQIFRDWVSKNKVPYDLSSQAPQDYDMRGFWKGLTTGDPHATTGIDPNDKKMHYTDYWKTPYHKSFSRESKFAGESAPTWQGDKLVGADGTVYFDDAAQPQQPTAGPWTKFQQAAPTPATPGVTEQTMGGAANTWLEHAIGDVPIVGPALQTGSDYLGTEIYGRLSGQDPSKMREDMWKRREQRTADYPASSLSGALAGNIAATGAAGSTVGGARALGISGNSLLGRAGASAATTGSVSAADQAMRGGSGADVINNGAIGAGIGGAIPIVGSGINAVLRAAGGKVAPIINAVTDPVREAARRLGTAMERDTAANPGMMMGGADEAVAKANNVPVINADRGGETTRALARSVANQSPEARAVIENTASDRFAGQGARAAEFVRKLTGGSADDLALQDLIRQTAQTVNKPAYGRAYGSPRAQDMWDTELAQLMQAPAMQAAARDATTRGANRAAVDGFKAVKNPFVERNGRFVLNVAEDGSIAKPTLQFWDQVKRNLDSDIGKAARAGDNTLKADLTALKSKLVSTLDGRVPEYKAARQGAASFFGAEDALEAGKKFAGTPRLVPEAERAFATFTEPEKRAFRTGFASEMIDRIKLAGDRTNVINSVFKSQAVRESMELVFGPQKARELEAYIRVEDLADRLRGAMGNSTTARQLVELGIGAGGGAYITGDWTGAVAGALTAKGVRYAGERADAQVMQQIGKMLMSDDPKALQSAVGLAKQSPVYMRALEKLSSLLAVPVRGAAMAGAQ